MNITRDGDETMALKLYHRTHFWGKDLHGYKARGHKLPIIQVQAIMGEERGSSSGCCRHHGRRVVQLDESHILANSRDDWKLYHVKTILGEESEHGDYFHDFALIPKSKATKKNIGTGWTLLGEIRPCIARMELAVLLRPFLANNNFEHTYATHHAHINLAMKMVTVDDGRHERRPRAERQHQNNHKSNLSVDERWQQPTPGMPFYSRNGAQQRENATTNKKKLA